MADSPIEPPAIPSPSNPTPPAAPTFQGPGKATRVPPLRVLTNPQARKTPSPTSLQPGATASGAGVASGDPVNDNAAATSTPSSGKHAVKVDKSALAEIIQGAVLTASLWVHDTLARTDEARDAQIWVADNQDQKQIGEPLANIAARHGAPEVASPDTADLIAAGIGALAYVVKHSRRALALRLRLRRRLRQAAAAENIPSTQGVPL